MESEMYRLLQPQMCDRTSCHVVGVEDRERTYSSLCIKYLTDYGPLIFVIRVADEYGLASQVMQWRRLINVARFCAGPVCVCKLIEEFPALFSSCGDAKHPKVSICPGKPMLSNR